jgi:Fuc2NAc and GlcNAc transferase
LNLYNFMDGIDGLAAGQAVAVGTIGGVMLLLVGHPSLAVVAFCVAAASAGFLVWNWAPAQIFMGDAGSGFLGFAFVALAFASERVNAVPFAAWLVLLGVFFFDTTITLLRRMARGEKWREGHRLHAFQRISIKIGSHGITSSGILVFTVILAIMAWWLTLYPQFYIAILGGAAVMLTSAYAWVETVSPMFEPLRATPSVHSPLAPTDRLLAGAEIFEQAGGDLVMSRPHPYEHHREEPIGTRSMSA